ncbi:MAG: HEAT repeat domain-containing protein, partial [Asgard group archaeon]
MENTDDPLRNDDETSLRKTQEKLTKLIKDLEDEDDDVRWNAVEELGKIRDVRAAEALTKLLLDKDIELEYRAVELLGQMGEIAVEPLIKALKNKNCHIRDRAAEILGLIGDARAIEPLIQALEDALKYYNGDVNVWEEKVANALVLIWKPSVEPLINALKDKNSAKIHWMIEKILVSIGEPAIEPH